MTRLFLLFLTAIVPSVSLGEPSAVEHILDDSGVRGGLVVHIGCGDGKLTAALQAEGRFLVHGLDTNANHVAAAQSHLRSLGLYGQVSVAPFDGKHLPYADNLVNLIVAESPVDVSTDEILRVLVPRGVAYLKTNGQWQRTVKPWPEGMDEWTHFLHGADGNAVSRDKLVGRPQRLRWVAAPSFSRHHDEVLGTSAMVTGGGRIFSIVDEAPRSTFHPAIGGKFFLIVRDAFHRLRLVDETVCSELDCFNAPLVVARAGVDDHGNIEALFLELAQHLETVDPGHFEIENHAIHRFIRNEVERFLAACGDARVVAPDAFQIVCVLFRQVGDVVYHQNQCHMTDPSMC